MARTSYISMGWWWGPLYTRRTRNPSLLYK